MSTISKKYILAIDQGTTGTTTCLIDQNGQCLAKVNEEHEQIYPRPSWVEHNPDHIWSTVLSSIRQVFERPNKSGENIKSGDIAAIGITNQRETTLIWDKTTGKPIYNAIVWQCRRTTDFCKELKRDKGLEKKNHPKNRLGGGSLFLSLQTQVDFRQNPRGTTTK